MSARPPEVMPFDAIGGGAVVTRLVEVFYDVMREREPALADLHACEPDGRVSEGSRKRFEQFLFEWLGGPRIYSPVFGHPRLRMRHAHVPVDTAMIEAWLRCMQYALDVVGVQGDTRVFLDRRFREVAEFMRNRTE
jgi:hemoglobin